MTNSYNLAEAHARNSDQPKFPFGSSCYKDGWEQVGGGRGVPVGVAAAGMRPLLAFTPKASSAFSSVTSCSHIVD